MDAIDPSGKISPRLLEKSEISQKTEDKEQGQPGSPRPKGEVRQRNRRDARETGEKSSLDILV